MFFDKWSKILYMTDIHKIMFKRFEEESLVFPKQHFI